MKFSIVIPIYNCEEYLVECLESVLNQTHKDWECICVDDGSTDKSGKIADEYSEKDFRFKVVHKENGGEGSARNEGLRASCGEWIFFLDSDDIINNQTLEICAKGVDLYPNVDLSCINMIEFTDGNMPSWYIYKDIKWKNIDISRIITSQTLGMPVWTIAYKAEMAKTLKFTNMKVGADRVYVYNILEKSKSIVLSNYIGYGYRKRIGSIVNSKMTEEKFLSDLQQRMYLLDIIKSSKKVYSKTILSRYAKDLTEYMAYCYFQMTRKEQTTAKEEWCCSMQEASNLILGNTWCRFVTKACGLMKSRWIIWILCYFPFWLKAHGINRNFTKTKI